MDAEKFDLLTRTFGSGPTRRQALAALAAVPALWLQRGRAAQLGPPSCGSAGKVCTMLAGCCDGLTCVTSAINTNYGVCVSGGSGGTMASGTSLVSPFSESAQRSGTVDSPSSTTTTSTTTGTTTTTTTDPRAERQAKLQERRSRRSTRRNKIQSRRTTKATARKTRREDAEEAAILAAGPELEFFVSMPDDSEGKPYEELTVSNLSDITATLRYVRSFDGADTDLTTSMQSSESLKNTLSPGGSIGLVSGRGDGKVDNDQYSWSTSRICKTVSSEHGWIVRASFGSESVSRSYTIRCNDTYVGPNDASEPTNNRRKRKKKQQDAQRRKKRKQNHKKGR
ncbi:MAG: hypothetical protein R2853_20830 [Thermomicrobiales bacterium]